MVADGASAPLARSSRAADSAAIQRMDSFIEFCVSAGEMEPLFVRLVDEYRAEPTISKAVALYDIFCAPCAPAKVKADPLLPPHDLRIAKAMRPIRLNWTRMQAAFVFGPTTRISARPPARSLFDAIARYLAESDRFRGIKRRYTAWSRERASTANDFQEHFMRRIWEPIISPHLLAAGFSELAAGAAGA